MKLSGSEPASRSAAARQAAIVVEQVTQQKVRVTGYRRGTLYSLEADETSGWEEIQLELEPQVRIERSGRGQLLLYRGYLSIGMGLPTALKLGWCRVVGSRDGG